jgi:hypothetical protein
MSAHGYTVTPRHLLTSETPRAIDGEPPLVICRAVLMNDSKRR